jgi:hypothetical protein
MLPLGKFLVASMYAYISGQCYFSASLHWCTGILANLLKVAKFVGPL